MNNGDSSNQDLRLLQDKLSRLEESLHQILESTETDLAIAEQLQKVLFKNRIPQVPGLKCLARYISAQQVSSEGFDILPTQKGREIWIIANWTQSFGLSSVLLQTLMHLQSQATLASKPSILTEEVFNDLSISLTEAKRKGQYRLLVARLDTLSLKVSGYATGMLPFLKRKRDRNLYVVPEFMDESFLRSHSNFMEPANSDAPVTAERAYSFGFTIEPGSRLFFLGSSWLQNCETSALISEAKTALDFHSLKPTSELREDLNHFLIRGQDYLKAESRESDLTGIALEVDPSKLHLA